MVCFQHRVRPQIAADPVLIQQHSEHPEQDRSSSIRSYIDKEPVSAPFQTVCFQHRVQPHIAADPVLNQQHSDHPEQDRSSNIRSCPLATTPSSSPSRTLSVTVNTPPPRLPPRARPCLLCLAGCSGAPPPAICLCCPCTCSRTTSPFRAARYFHNTAPNGQGAIIVFVSPTFTRVPFGLHHPVSHLQSVEAGPRVLVSSTDVSPTLRPVDRPLKVHHLSAPAQSLPCAIGFMLALILLLSCYGCKVSAPTPRPHNQVSSSDDCPVAHRRGTAGKLPEPHIMHDTTKSFDAGAARDDSQSLLST